MSFHYLKSSEISINSSKLSEVINLENLINKDLLDLSYLNLDELDQIPISYSKVKKLNLTYNRFNNLSTLSQFQHLTHIFLSNNQIENFNELEKISNKEQVLVLTIEKNPISTHPNLLSFCVLIFPKLEEINGEKITDYMRQDLLDGIELSKQVISFLSKNQILMQKKEKILKICLKRLENSFEDLDENENFSHQSKIRPCDILDLIKRVEKSILQGLTDRIDLKIQEKVLRWLSYEILNNLKSSESNELISYLKSRANHSDPDTSFNLQLEIFQSMKYKLEKIPKYSEIFLNQTSNSNLNLSTRLISSYFELTEDFTSFPIFPFNSEYLQALILILQLQAKQLEDLYIEKLEINTLDVTILNIPESLNKSNETTESISNYFSQQSKSSSKSNPKEINSLIILSPNHSNEMTQNNINTKTQEENFIRNLEKSKIIEMKNEVENEKSRLKKRIKDLEDKEKLKMEKIMENFREKQKKMEKFRKKFEDNISRGFESMEKILLHRKKFGFDGILIKKIEEEEKVKRKNEKLEKIQRAKKFFEEKLMLKAFGPLRFFQIYSKTQRIRAQEFYNGKSLLDHFYKWKIFLNNLKKQKKIGLDKKISIKEKENKEKLETKIELKNLLKKIISDENNIKRLMNGLKEKKVKINRDCACGGFKCKDCVKEKTNIIKNELKVIKSDMSKDKKRFNIR